jgi:small subunit ribosomal protein S7
MSRRTKAPKRNILPDHKHQDMLVAEFVSCLLKRGKRSTAEHLFYDALDLLEKKSGQPGVEAFHRAMENVKPSLEVKSRRVGGATYQVPVEVRSNRRIALAIRWLIATAAGRNDKSMADKLAAEFLAASNNEGGAVKKKEDTHKMAEANKAFAHFRW